MPTRKGVAYLLGEERLHSYAASQNAIRRPRPFLIAPQAIDSSDADKSYRPPMANQKLNAAKRAKKDEFYTQLSDIERELQHYWPHFRGKTVLCNCDDPYESNFFKYFALRFNQLGLRRLVCTCYGGSPVQGNELLLPFDDFPSPPRRPAYKVEITEVRDLNGDGSVDLSDVKILLQNDRNVLAPLETGDFRSRECLALLRESDIVVTNPPLLPFPRICGAARGIRQEIPHHRQRQCHYLQGNLPAHQGRQNMAGAEHHERRQEILRSRQLSSECRWVRYR